MNRMASVSYQDDFAEDLDRESAGEQLDLQHYLRILRKHKWLIVLFSAALTALAAYYAFTATPIYKATSTLLIEEQRANVVSIEELYGVDTENADYYETQFQLLRSPALAQRVVERMGLWTDPELSPEARTEGDQGAAQGQDVAGAGVGASPSTPVAGPTSVSETALQTREAAGAGGITLTDDQETVVVNFMNRLSVSPVRNTKLVNISYESADPALAARVANVVGEEYIQSHLDAKFELTTTISEWLTKRLGELKIDLDNAEDRLIAFQQANDLVDVEGSVGRLNEQQLLLDTAELTQARSRLAAAQDVFNDVQSLRGNPSLLETIPAVQADPLVQRTKIDQGAVQRQLDELLTRYGERHPRVLDAKSELASLQSALVAHIDRVAGTIANDLQLARQRVAAINAKLASGRSDIQDIGNKKFELDALQREVDTKRGIYDQYFSRMTEAASADGLETANARISDFARIPMEPVKPKKQQIIALAALASLVLAMLMAFLYEAMDDTVRGSNDIEVKLKQTLLGILPLIKGGPLRRSTPLPLNPEEITDKKGTFSEAVNTVRTALTLEAEQRPSKVIVVTSSVPGEGKSTTAINIAYSFGQLERVLLIDCDLRRPTVAKAAGLDKNVDGLSNLIAQTAPALACIRRGAFGGHVDILPSGPIPDQPLELLSSKRFERIVRELARYYDRIIIDSAPTQAVSDSLVLTRLADGVVYAVKSHDTSIDLVKRGLLRLQQAGARIAGIVVTQVDIDKIAAYGGDYFYQGYYDYYGYTEDGASNNRPGKIRLTQAELHAIKTDKGEYSLGFESVFPEAHNGQARDRQSPRRSPRAQVARAKEVPQRRR